MQRLIYISRVTEPIDARAMHAMLRSARDYNAIHEMTGLLVSDEDCFLQVLEGEEFALKASYKRICRDQRHENHFVLSDHAALDRMFSKWWMAYRAFDGLGYYQQKQFTDLKAIAGKAQCEDLKDDMKTGALLLAFLSGFQEMGMTG